MTMRHPLPSAPSRRTVVQALALAALVPPMALRAQQPAVDTLGPSAAAWRVLSRVGYGPTPLLAQSVRDLASARAWAQAQVDVAYAQSQQAPQLPTEVADIDAPLATLFARARQEREARQLRKADASNDKTPSPYTRASFVNDQDPLRFSQTMVRQAATWRLVGASQPELENPLLARMTEFWFNHLNVYGGKGPVRPFVGHYAVHVARSHALGKFEDLLLASARHPAMLFYLDQFQSVADGAPGRQGGTRGLNENYARELMELHTLGVDGGYNQTDVRALARILTGWTVSPNDSDGFRFAARLHDNSRKRLLGQDFPRSLLAGGEREGEDAIRMLARQPATARRVSRRLAQFFVADDPSPQLVRTLSDVFLSTQGDLRAVLRALFASTDFWVPANQLFKTPMDFALSALTVVQASAAEPVLSSAHLRRTGLTLAYLNSVGQPVHGWQTPDGYAFDAATWLVPEALTRRADFALALARQTDEPAFLRPYLGQHTLDVIADQAAPMRAGLMLASADFMRK